MASKSTTSPAADLRKSVRKVLLSNAIFVTQNVRLKSAITIDISTGGMSLTLPDALQVGQTCAISFDVPGQPGNQRTLIRGNISSCTANSDNGYRIGIHYVQSDPISQQLIKAAIDRYL